MRRTLILAMLLSTLMACGGGGSEESKDSGSSESSGTQSPEVSDDATAAPQEAIRLNDKQLEAVLPELEDMPPGFSPSSDESEDDSDTDFLCGLDVGFEDKRNANASVDFSAQEGLSATEMSFGISQFDSADDASALFDEFVAQMEKCNSFNMEGDIVTVSPMSAGKIGDSTAAYKMTATSDGFDIAINLILTTAGPSTIGSLSASAGLTGSTINDLSQLTTQTVDQYKTVAGTT